jgi:hypothetical protein
MSKILLGALVTLLIMSSFAYCTTSGRRNANGLGVIVSEDNTYTYDMGVVMHGQVIEDEKGREYTSIDFAPSGAALLYPESILLCGNQAAPLTKWPLKVVVLTYERQAHTMFKGIGCHELMGVDLISGQEQK